ncbi:MAG: hypothetical protein R3E96_03860 [Planctomycetota bacterium]
MVYLPCCGSVPEQRDLHAVVTRNMHMVRLNDLIDAAEWMEPAAGEQRSRPHHRLRCAQRNKPRLPVGADS